MQNRRPDRLSRLAAQLLVVDVQERLLPHIDGHEALLQQCERMIRAAGVLGIPITISEQYPRGLGQTAPALLAAAGGGAANAGDVEAARAARVQKMAFSVCADAACLAALRLDAAPQVLVIGIETHVCVQQTALDLQAFGARPFVLADAVGSRRTADREIALRRMSAAGVIVTTAESAIYELMHEAGTELFKRMLPIVK